MEISENKRTEPRSTVDLEDKRPLQVEARLESRARVIGVIATILVIGFLCFLFFGRDVIWRY